MTIDTSLTTVLVFAVTDLATGEIIQHLSNMEFEEVRIVI
jgi:hypothetical protein